MYILYIEYLAKFIFLMLAGIFFSKLISVWSLIRPCWVDIFLKINTRVDMAIRATRVGTTVESLNSVPQNSGKSHNRGQNMNDQLFM